MSYSQEATKQADQSKYSLKTFLREDLKTFAEVAGVLILGFYTFFTYQQWQVARGQLEALQQQLGEMKKGGSDTRTLAEGAMEQAAAMKVLAEQAIVAANANKDAARAAQTSATNSDRIARSTEQAVHVTQQANRLDERAWMDSSFVSSRISVGQIHAIIQFKNPGKTPAIHVTSNSQIDFMPATQTPNPKLNTLPSEIMVSNTLVGPNSMFSAVHTLTDPRLDDSALKSLNTGYSRLYARGIVNYEDVFHCKHWMTYCYVYDPRIEQFNACDFGNEVDRNECPAIH